VAARTRRPCWPICGDRLWIVSNNSTDTAETLSVRLGPLGFPISPAHIVLAGEETIRRVAQQRPGQRVAVYAAEPLCALARQLGLITDRAAPEAAILARDQAFSFACLTRLTAQVARGLPLMTTNPDASHPDGDGHPVPETGALWAAIAAAIPGLAIRSIGKPAPDLLQLALARAGVAPRDAVFIGDTPETDGIAARSAGVDFVLLRRPGLLQAGVAEVQPC
jgi:pyridoxal phosphatase